MRTDVHRPSSPDFDPEAYDCVGIFDSHPEWGDNRERGKIIQSLLDRGYKSGLYGSGQCGHCGTPIRYGALMVRHDVKEFIYIGEQCLDNRFEELTKAEFQVLRKAAKLNKERATKKEIVEATFEAYPWLSEIPTYGGDFLESLYDQARSGKTLSEKQVEAGQRALEQAKEREAKFQAQKAADAEAIAKGVKAPSGKVTVRGEVVSVKWHESPYGGSLKMIVKSEEGWRVWSTVPRDLQGAVGGVSGSDWKFSEDVQPGEQVEFSATLTPSNDDPMFAFAKRPTKAKNLSRA